MQPEVEEFLSEHCNDLRFTVNLAVEKKGGKKINPKRLRRIIEREIAVNARRGTKTQHALAEDREAHRIELKAETKQQRAERKEAAL